MVILTEINTISNPEFVLSQCENTYHGFLFVNCHRATTKTYPLRFVILAATKRFIQQHKSLSTAIFTLTQSHRDGVFIMK